VWTGSPTNETSKDIVQTELLGGLGENARHRLGAAPPDARAPTTRQAGVKNVADTSGQAPLRRRLGVHAEDLRAGLAEVAGHGPARRLDGRGARRLQDLLGGADPHPDVNGIMLVTFTPLSGATDLVQHFQDGGDGHLPQGRDLG
jgi:hypothetical protein